MSDHPSGGQIPLGTMSRDGRFRWDGRQWVEVGVWNVGSTGGQAPPNASRTAAPVASSPGQAWPRPPIPPPSGPPPSTAGQGAVAGTGSWPPQAPAAGAGAPWAAGEDHDAGSVAPRASAPAARSDAVSSPSLSGGVPRVGAFSQDGAFRWIGDRWEPVQRRRVPTTWTRKLQYLLAAYCAFAGIADIVITPIFHDRAALTRMYSNATLPSGVSAEQAATSALVFAIAFAVVIGILYLLLGLASLRGWNWVWWVVGVGLVFGLISFFTNIASLTNLSSSVITLPGLVVNQVVSAIAIVLLALFIWTTIKFGPWAKVKPRAATT